MRTSRLAVTGSSQPCELRGNIGSVEVSNYQGGQEYPGAHALELRSHSATVEEVDSARRVDGASSHRRVRDVALGSAGMAEGEDPVLAETVHELHRAGGSDRV